MFRKPFRRPNLIIPSEAVFCVLREFYVVGRIGVNEVVRLNRDMIEGRVYKFPIGEYWSICQESAFVIDC